MPKRKSKFIGFLLALFAGPLCFLYIGKWKKALLLFSLLWIPFLNAAIYIYCVFAIIPNVKRCNGDIYDNVRFGIVVCECQSQNKTGSKFCSNCGSKLVKACDGCKQSAGKNEKYCGNCGHAFTRMAKQKLAIKKMLSFA